MTQTEARSKFSYAVWACVLLAVAGGTWFYRDFTRQKQQQAQRIEALQKRGAELIGNRLWPEATAVFAEMESLAPNSKIAADGRNTIETGTAEEQAQYVGHWCSQAIARLEASQLSEATAAARQVLEKYPNQPEASQLLKTIEKARSDQARERELASAREALDQRKWQAALETAQRLLAASAADPEAAAILKQATAGSEKAATDKAQAQELFQKASALDRGQYDAEMLRVLREANVLDPENAQVAALLEKLASYRRTLHVPGDFATPAAALAAAHDQDRIILAPQVWKGPLVINADVDLQSADTTHTTIECSPADGSVITIGPAAKAARIKGITFRHQSFAIGSERFAVALVRGGSVSFSDCRFEEASGHGLAVIEKGSAVADHCRFYENGWDGAAAIGEGSQLEVTNSEALRNYEHGIETWDGASAVLSRNRCVANYRNGIHIANLTAAATLSENELLENHEFGLVIDSAGSGQVTKNIARSNLLGGYVVRLAAAPLVFTGNEAALNLGAGLLIDKGLPSAAYRQNTVSNNVPLPAPSPALQEDAPPAAIVIPEPPAGR
jgi:Right handed beta helix region